MNLLWQNGSFIRAEDFQISPKDRGLLHGLGVFETFLAVDGRPIFLKEHIERLESACLRLGWKAPHDDWRQIVIELLDYNQLSKGAVRCRLTLTAGEGSLSDISASNLQRWLSVECLGEVAETTSAILSPWRLNEHAALAGIKSSSYAENALALDSARRLGFQQAILLNTAGELAEAATGNIFLVKNHQLYTPSLVSGALPGIVRKIVIDLARAADMPVHEVELSVTDLDEADEVFITSSLQGVVPLAQFHQRLWTEMGPMTLQLQAAYREKISWE